MTTVGQMAWLVAQYHGNLAVSGLTIQKRDEEWASLSMRRLGDNPETLVLFKELIDRINRERSVQRDGRVQSWQRDKRSLLIDNSACESLTRNVGVSKPTEHFLRWQHYLRWLVYHKNIRVCDLDLNQR